MQMQVQTIDQNIMFTDLYEEYYQRIYNYVHYRVSDFHTADDLVSLIFEKVLAKFSYYQVEKASLSTWLFTIARNTITDYYRSQSRSSFMVTEITSDLRDPKPDPCDEACFNEVRGKLLKALLTLSSRERKMIYLKYWCGVSNRHIATCLKISESNVGVILFRAIKQLRLTLEE